MKPGVLIFGSGAMGCLFSWRLAASGLPVYILSEWQEGVDAINSFGVRRIEPDGTEQALPISAYTDPSVCNNARYAIVLTKSWQTRHRARWLKKALAPDGIALTLQNGLGNYEILELALGAERTAVGSTTAGSTLMSPGRYQTLGEGEIIIARHPCLGELPRYLENAGFPVRTVKDVQSVLWGKLVVNAAINPITALLDVPNGYLLENPSARMIFGLLADETAKVANEIGIALPYKDPKKYVGNVIKRTSKNSSSMRQDLYRLAPTEVEAINGAVVRMAAKAGIQAPFNQSMYSMIKARLDVLRNINGANNQQGG